jgi:hypothetical protein
MFTTLSSARRIGATLAIAGIAALGSVTLAPAASAAPLESDGPISVIEGNGHGPDKFIVLENGQRIPVFYCDDDKPNKQHNNCEAPVVADGPRF